MFLKICGITRLTDAQHAVDAGATALGFVLWPESPRFVSDRMVAEIVAALPASVMTVGVFVNAAPEGIALAMTRTGLKAVQLHGDEPSSYASAMAWPILRSVTLADAGDVFTQWPADTTFLVDAADPVLRGGTGARVDWTSAAPFARGRRLVLAGGLTPENVAAAVMTVRPYGVDVSSGVEDAPGVKNVTKIAQFCASARQALADAHAEIGKHAEIRK